MPEAPHGGRAGRAGRAGAAAAAASAAATLPEAAWARIAACADLDSRRALRATCSALRRLADAGCASIALPGGEPAAAAADVRAARAGAVGGLRRLCMRGVGDECAAALLELLRAAPG
jgi:hypothetical protein